MESLVSRVARRAVWLGVSIMLLTPSLARADALTGYSVQVLAQLGQKGGDFSPTGAFGVGQMNDNGQFAFLTFLGGSLALVQYSDGKFIPIAVGGGPALGGKSWPKNGGFGGPPSMNEAGNIAFQPTNSNGAPVGDYLWDAGKQTIIPIAEPGTPADNGLVFTAGGFGGGATLNNRNEVAFVGHVKLPSGGVRDGLFLRRADGQIHTLALQGDTLPGKAGKLVVLGQPAINDAGRIAFTGGGNAIPYTHSYLWEQGALSIIADPSTPISGFGPPAGAQPWWLNNGDDSVIFGGYVENPQSPGHGMWGLFLWNDGQFTPVVLPGQQMPGGGTFVGKDSPVVVGFPNEVGQFPFVLSLNDNGKARTSAFVVDTAGKLILIATNGTTTDAGTITRIDPNITGGIAINSQGQVVVDAQLNGGAPSLLLLTPKKP